MSFFDHFEKNKATKIGAKIANISLRKTFRFIEKNLINKKIDILEIGPGKGNLAELFIENGFNNYDVSEPNEKMQEVLKEKKIRKIKKYLIPKLDEKDQSYDLIILVDVFEHLNGYKEADKFIEEAYRVLKKDGILAIASPDYTDWKEHFYNSDYSHAHPTTVRRTHQMFLNYDIKTLDYRYFYGSFNSFPGKIFNLFAKTLTTFFSSLGNDNKSKIYKLKLTFLRRFLIVGKKN